MLSALSDPVRIEMVFRLGRQGPQNVGSLASQFDLTRPAVSHHLKVLKDAGVVRSERHGQEVHYQVDRDALVSTLRAVADSIERCCAGTSCS